MDDVRGNFLGPPLGTIPVCAYNEVIEPYNQLDAAYKETLKHTIISHNIMK